MRAGGLVLGVERQRHWSGEIPKRGFRVFLSPSWEEERGKRGRMYSMSSAEAAVCTRERGRRRGKVLKSREVGGRGLRCGGGAWG